MIVRGGFFRDGRKFGEINRERLFRVVYDFLLDYV